VLLHLRPGGQEYVHSFEVIEAADEDSDFFFRSYAEIEASRRLLGFRRSTEDGAVHGIVEHLDRGRIEALRLDSELSHL
jgi:hypothetical protein